MRLTERQWLLKGYLPKEGAEGKLLSSGSCYGSCHMYVYFSEEDVNYLPDKAKQIRKEEREKAKARRKAELKYLDDHIEKTAWQWLEYDKRIPFYGLSGHTKTIRYPDYDGEYGTWKESKWYYYYKKETVEVSEEEYQRLKDLYIKKFGGWEEIDLEHTDYNGQIWW